MLIKILNKYRGHTVKSVTECFHLSKDAGFKVRYLDFFTRCHDDMSGDRTHDA